MEKYIINGVEVEYDTFALSNIELLEAESTRVNELISRAVGSNSAKELRIMCEAVLDFFDAIMGDGTSEKIFGRNEDVFDLIGGFYEFSAKVKEETAIRAAKLKELVQRGKTDQGMNREQRRAAERAKRREDAALMVAQKKHEE